MTQATLTKTGIVVGRSTRIYTDYLQADGLHRQVFMPVRDLVNDARDPYIATLHQHGQPQFRHLNPIAVNEVVEDRPDHFWDCYVVSDSGLQDLREECVATLHYDAVVNTLEGGTQAIGQLIGRYRQQLARSSVRDVHGQPLTGLRFNCLTFSFTDMRSTYASVVFCLNSQYQPRVTVDTDSQQWANANNWVVLGGGLMIAK